jgi:hypothetical protein
VAKIAGDNIDRLTSDRPKLVSLFDEKDEGNHDRQETLFPD